MEAQTTENWMGTANIHIFKLLYKYKIISLDTVIVEYIIHSGILFIQN